METNLLFIYVETPLHAGSGRGLGGVDLPIQREKVTNYPMVQGSSLKGRLRAYLWDNKYDRNDKHPELLAIFGETEGTDGKSYAGAVSVSDARLLLFPVRSLNGVFAWVTSRDVLARFRRDVQSAKLPLNWSLLPDPGQDECWVSTESKIEAQGKVTLEEFTYTAKKDQGKEVDALGQWLANNALPDVPEYKYWQELLPHHLVILPPDDFRDFTQYGTEVSTHIKLVPDTKTVKGGALWVTESLPTETLLYTPLAITDSRAQGNTSKTAEEIRKTLRGLHHQRTQLGGDETTGRGIVMLRFLDKSEVKV